MPVIQGNEKQVRAANRKLYDAVAGDYEAIDGRRSDALCCWLRSTLRSLRTVVRGDVLIDLGAGGGLVSRCAEGIFNRRYGIDISPRILTAHAREFDSGVVSLAETMPFAPGSIHCIAAFAVLHHLHSYEELSEEAARVIAPGGVFYSDHDLDSFFHSRWKCPLALYRRLRDAKGQYLQAGLDLDEETYHLTEFHADGVDAGHVAALFKRVGFNVSLKFHWYGLTRLTNAVFGEKNMVRGIAPIMQIVAVRRHDQPEKDQCICKKWS